MWAEDFIYEAREMAEELMLDTCQVERSLGLVTDPVTAVVSEAWETVYAGKCKVAGDKTQAASPQAGGHVFTVEQLQVHLPVSALSVTGDRVTIQSAVLDADLVGTQFRLTELARGSYRTADRWNVELVTQ